VGVWQSLRAVKLMQRALALALRCARMLITMQQGPNWIFLNRRLKTRRLNPARKGGGVQSVQHAGASPAQPLQHSRPAACCMASRPPQPQNGAGGCGSPATYTVSNPQQAHAAAS
jgi:hypothetical protein